MSKILLTGASGFLGKHIYNYLYHKKFEIITIGRSSLNDIVCDLSFEVPFLKTNSLTLVIHAAGKAHSVPKTEQEKKHFFAVNVQGTENLLNELENTGKPKQFVFISSVSVYGQEEGNIINENHPLNAKDSYGLSKIEAETLVADWCKRNSVICTILRLPLLVGEIPPGNLGAMIKAIEKGYYFNIGGGKAKKSMVLAADVAAFITKVSNIGGIYNLTDGYHPSFYELSSSIANRLHKKIPFNLPLSVAKVFGRFGDLLGSKAPINSLKLKKITTDLTFDDTKARQIAGWNPQRVLSYFE